MQFHVGHIELKVAFGAQRHCKFVLSNQASIKVRSPTISERNRKVKETVSLSEGRSSDMSDLMIHVQETQMQAKVEHCHRV